MEQEIWKDITWYEWKYQASNLWRIKSLKNNKWGLGGNKILKPQNNSRWYYKIILEWKKFYVHRLVMWAFKWESILDVNHKNGIKSDNKLENLEYCTRSYNIKHSFNELWRKPSWLNKKWALHHSSIKVNQYDLEWNFIKTYWSLHEAWEKLNIFYQNINHCCKWKRKTTWWYIWKYS
jgi:hypothetical protein